MSHIAKIDITIKNIPALRAAVAELCPGASVVEASFFQCYQTLRGQPQACKYAIKLPGVTYEVGVVEQDGGTYALAFDAYGRSAIGSEHDGHRVVEKFGNGLSKLKQHYGIHFTTMLARQRGCQVQRIQQANGSVRLAISGGTIR